MIIKQQAKSFILLTQEGKFITHLVVGVGVQVALCALLAAGAQRHGAEVVSSEVAQPALVLGRLLAIAMITFIFTLSNHRSGLASALLLPRSSLVLVLVLVLALVVTPRPVIAIRP
jgi:hypothetical protein